MTEFYYRLIFSAIFQEVNLHQIGLGRSEGEPCVPLLIKSLFTCMFWVTLRQRVQEIKQRRQSAAVTDMAAPLQLTVSTAGSGKCYYIYKYIDSRKLHFPNYLYYLTSC